LIRLILAEKLFIYPFQSLVSSKDNIYHKMLNYGIFYENN